MLFFVFFSVGTKGTQRGGADRHTRFNQMTLSNASDLKIVLLASNHRHIGKVRFSGKVHKTHFSGRAEHVLAKWHFPAPQISKSNYSAQIGKAVRFSDCKIVLKIVLMA